MPNLRSDAFTIALVFAVGLALVFGAHLYDRSHELPTEPIINVDVQGVLPLLSVGEMTLRLYTALNYSQNSARDLRRTLNGA